MGVIIGVEEKALDGGALKCGLPVYVDVWRLYRSHC